MDLNHEKRKDTKRKFETQRLIQQLASTRPVAWLLARILPSLDYLVLRLTSQRQSLTGLLAGLPVVILTTTGARSGQPRRVPLIAFPDGDKLALFATNWGQRRHPAWYYNLRAHPHASVTYRDQTRSYRACLASGTEYERRWAQAVVAYAGYQAYRLRARKREIAIFILEPIDQT